jgi:hypothetical protein
MIEDKIDSSELPIEKEDFMSIFLDNSSNQLEDQFFKSKLKLINAQVNFILNIFQEREK